MNPQTDVSQPPRVLLVDDDSFVLDVAGDLLHAAGFEVQLLMYPTLTVPTAQQFKPDVVVIDAHMPVLSGREVMNSFQSFEHAAAIPVVLFSGRWDFREQVRCFHAGAVDLWTKPLTAEHPERLHALLARLRELRASPGLSRLEQIRRHFLEWSKRERVNGSVVLNPGTPFEGRAIFTTGELSFARMGPLYAVPALDEMLTIDEGAWRFEENVVRPPPVDTTPFESLGYSPRVLIVDDDPDLSRLAEKQLVRQGYRVDTALQGEEGYRLAQAGAFDVVVADLNMPVLDGWGMLRRMKGDARTRETPILFLSAHDDYRETLKAARAGAQDYLRKTGHAGELVKKVRSIAAPRVNAWNTIKQKQPVKNLELASVGPQWLLKSIAELDGTWSVDATDDWGTYRLKIDRGMLREAVAEAGVKKLNLGPAVRAFLVSRHAQVTLTPEFPPPLEPGPPWVQEEVDDARRYLNALEDKIHSDRLDRVNTFSIDAELAGLFLRVGAEQDVRLLRALTEAQVAPDGLAAHLKMSAETVRDSLRELMRRGVLKPQTARGNAS